VTDGSEGTLSVVDTAINTVITIITTPDDGDTGALAVAPSGHHAYIANNSSTTIFVINTATNAIATIPVELYPYGLAISPDGARVYVAGSSSSVVPGTVSVIATGAAATTRG
jgi:YVTN family beta-propeller protein